jgi:hypothetical protein
MIRLSYRVSISFPIQGLRCSPGCVSAVHVCSQQGCTTIAKEELVSCLQSTTHPAAKSVTSNAVSSLVSVAGTPNGQARF